MTQQGLRQESFRIISGTSTDYNGDSLAAFIVEGATSDTYDGAFIEWLQIRTGSTGDNINDLKQLFAIQQGAHNWDAVGLFIPFASGKLWLDNADTSSITQAAAKASQVDDKFRNGNDATQGSATDQPTFSTINGVQALHGDGANVHMDFDNLGLNGLTDVSVFMVFVIDATTTGFDNPIAFGTASEGRLECRGVGDTDEIKSIGLGFDDGTTIGAGFNTAQVLSLLTNATDWSTWVDGTPVIVADSSTAAWSTGAGSYAIFAGSDNNRNMKGDIGEVIIYSKEVSSAVRLHIEKYLISKWGL